MSHFEKAYFYDAFNIGRHFARGAWILCNTILVWVPFDPPKRKKKNTCLSWVCHEISRFCAKTFKYANHFSMIYYLFI